MKRFFIKSFISKYNISKISLNYSYMEVFSRLEFLFCKFLSFGKLHLIDLNNLQKLTLYLYLPTLPNFCSFTKKRNPCAGSR